MANLEYRMRVRAGIAACQINLAVLAERCGVTRQALHNTLSAGIPGKRYPRILAEALGTTESWLVDGDGSPPAWWTAPPAPRAERPVVDRRRRRGPAYVPADFDIAGALQSVLTRMTQLEHHLATTTAAHAKAQRENARKDARIEKLERELATVRALAADLGRKRTKTG